MLQKKSNEKNSYLCEIDQLRSKKLNNIPNSNDWSTAPNNSRTINCKAQSIPAEVPSSKDKCDIK